MTLKMANEALASGQYSSAIELYTKLLDQYRGLLKESIDFNLWLANKKIKNSNLIGNQFKENYRPMHLYSALNDNLLNPELYDYIFDKKPIICNETNSSELITVIIPMYNGGSYIRKSINSVLSQVDVNLEIIVVNDGSFDMSLEYALKTSAQFKNIKIINTLRNFGCYYARNIGVMNAQGSYITVVDSDDIMPPTSLRDRLSAIKSTPGALACIGLGRRWAENYSHSLSELSHIENTLLWKREILNKIGYYDSVRFGGDSEFRLRIQRYFGADRVLKISKELYYLRQTHTGLTSSATSGSYCMEGKKLTKRLSAPRIDYQDAFTKWQKLNIPNRNEKLQLGMFIPFPLRIRPFSLGSEPQNASPSLKQSVVGNIASFPPRLNALRSAVESILPQVDKLNVYLNQYKNIPDFLFHEKITVFNSDAHKGDLRDNGKFYKISTLDNCYIFTFDDDLIYPPDYVQYLLTQIEMFGREVIVGLHGVIFPDSDFNNLRQRTVFLFSAENKGTFVDLLGTGTTAWHSSTIKFDLDEFKSLGVCDLWFASVAARNFVPMYSAPRRSGWLREFNKFDDSLWRETVENPAHYFSTFTTHLKLLLKRKIRHRFLQHLLSIYNYSQLSCAGLNMTNIVESNYKKYIAFEEKSIKTISSGNLHRITELIPTAVRLHVIITGWNCGRFVEDCVRSLAQQEFGDFQFEVTFIDDGSSDSTSENILSSSLFPRANVIRISENTGAAYARHVGILSVSNPNDVIVLLDMDDYLAPHALKTVANVYSSNSKCLMTIGNWRDSNGKLNPQPFYTKDDIDSRRVRVIELFNATHLRTFKRHLYDALDTADFIYKDGRWLESCTDVALMFPLLDQCYGDEVVFIKDPLYIYRQKLSSGTLERFGKPHKAERLAWLRNHEIKARVSR